MTWVILLVLLGAVLGVIVWMVAWGVTPSAAPRLPLYTQGTSAPLDAMRALVVAQLEHVGRRSPRNYEPYGPRLAVLSDTAKAATSFEQLGAIGLLEPFYALDYGPVLPVRDSRVLIPLQFGTGKLGWYWFLAFDQAQQLQVFVAVERVTVCAPPVAQSHQLSAADASYYSVTVSIGTKAGYTSSTFRGEGTYTAQAPPAFGLTVGAFSLTYAQDSFRLKWAGTTSGDLTFSVPGPPSPNAPRGCAPCVSGSGTAYVSYPRPRVTGTVGSLRLSDAPGWIDRQMGGSFPRSGLAIGTMLTLMAGRVGLGPYVWGNLHVGDTAYMVYSFPPNPRLAVGDILPMTVITYFSNGDVVYDESTLATITSMQSHFVTGYSIALGGKSVKLSAPSVAVYTDVTGNPHAIGAATGPGVWGFLETSGTTPGVLEGTLKAAGVPEASWPVVRYDHKRNRAMFTSMLISFFVLAVVALVLVVLVFIFALK